MQFSSSQTQIHRVFHKTFELILVNYPENCGKIHISLLFYPFVNVQFSNNKYIHNVEQSSLIKFLKNNIVTIY